MYLTENDEITMKLVHYFITKEDYQPIIVAGSENEIWLENNEKPYSVIRINGNYIHNNEQLEYDVYKCRAIVKQIKRKTLSFNCDLLNILINLGENVKMEKLDEMKHIDTIEIDSANDKRILEIFPDIKKDKVDSGDAVDFFLNVTKDINEVTEKRNKLYEKTFKKKTVIVTYALMALNIAIFLLQYAFPELILKFGMSSTMFKSGEYYRVITAAFLHGGLMHIACNMYSLYVIGPQVENVLGKWKFLTIYLVSAITASLFSGVAGMRLSVGASGAIFGLLGSLVYFGYHYRLFLGNSLLTSVIPIILINLAIGFSIPNVDNFAHIGGLIGGAFASMAVGIEGKTDKSDRINGTIVTIILIGFLVYMLLFR